MPLRFSPFVAHIRVHTHTQTYVYVCMCMYVCTYTAYIYTYICSVYIYVYFKNTKNLFIHIALIPLGDLLEISQHFKMSPPFASSEGVSVSGDRYQSDDA